MRRLPPFGFAFVAAVTMLAAAGCRTETTHAPTPTVEAAAPLAGWHYRVRVTEELSRADVRMCFEGTPPEVLIPGVEESAKFVDDAATASGDSLRRRGGKILLGDLGDDACIDYAVDLDDLVDQSRRRRASRVGDSIVMRTSQWLWRPPALPVGADVTVTFDLPPDVSVSVPWPHARTGRSPTYRLDKTAFKWLGYTILGDIGLDRFERDGTEFTVTTLDADLACTQTDLRRWVADAADSVAMLYGGRFPRERMQVVVVPVEGGGGSVYFGMASRGGGAAIYILMDEDATGHELPGGWTTVHEMLHHGMPFVSDAWMGEGWVSYYTEIVRTRIGHRDEATGWEKLREAFARGRRGGRFLPLGETSERMRDTHAYQRVYWGGAAIAFILDVELRTRTGGEKSFDDAMRYLRECCGDAEHQWTARQLLDKLDAWYGEPLFSETAEAYLASSDFPPVDEAFARLGVSFGAGGHAILDDDHENARHRRAIMAPRREP